MIPQVNSLPKNNKSRPNTALVRDEADEHRVVTLAEVSGVSASGFE